MVSLPLNPSFQYSIIPMPQVDGKSVSFYMINRLQKYSHRIRETSDDDCGVMPFISVF
jgi:hypothetical protein